MGYADRSGHAITNPRAPRAFAVCDSCGAWWNRHNLLDQYEWYGDALTDTRLRVCPRCISKPQDQFRPIILPPDPVPIDDPRPEFPDINQNLNGFVRMVGPKSGPSLTFTLGGSALGAGGGPVDPLGPQAGTPYEVASYLDPTNPFETKLDALSSAGTGWGAPFPTLLTDRGGTIGISGVPVLLAAANPARQYLLIYNPAGAVLAIAQGFPILGASGTMIVGTGEAILQNTLATPPSAIWQGAVYALGLIAGMPWFAWEG